MQDTSCCFGFLFYCGRVNVYPKKKKAPAYCGWLLLRNESLKGQFLKWKAARIFQSMLSRRKLF